MSLTALVRYINMRFYKFYFFAQLCKLFIFCYAGGVVGTATFLSSQDVTAQTFSFTVNYLNDNVALEPNEIFTYILGNIRGDARIGMPNSTTHTLVDDDSKKEEEEEKKRGGGKREEEERE